MTYRPNGGLFPVYERAYAVRCQADGTASGEVDLTRTPEDTHECPAPVDRIYRFAI